MVKLQGVIRSELGPQWNLKSEVGYTQARTSTSCHILLPGPLVRAFIMTNVPPDAPAAWMIQAIIIFHMLSGMHHNKMISSCSMATSRAGY